MASLHISLPDRMRHWVDARIEQDGYVDESEYIRDLIRRDQRSSGAEDGITEAIESGLRDAESGRVSPADEVFNRLEAKYAAMAAERADRR